MKVVSLVYKGLGLALLSVGLGGCSQEKPTGVIPEAQKQALEKANAVEDTLKAKDEALRKALDDAT